MITKNIFFYFFIISFSFVFCLFWAKSRFKKFNLDVAQGLEITMALIIGGFIGSKAFFIFFVAPDVYFEEAFIKYRVHFWSGGFVFYGGFIGGLMASWTLIKWKNLSFYVWADTLAPVIAGGYALGRLACFINGCCYGKFCDLPWAVESRHPTQLYAFFLEGLILLFLLWKEKELKLKKSHPGKGEIFFLWIALHSTARLFMESFRDDFRGTIYMFSISTWISLLLLALSLFFLTFPHFIQKLKENQKA